jgi:TolB-like protein/Tfp pilus assembly protein PilF
MSPEQVRARELDARSDLFSFGAVLYEMATGTPPFRGESSGVIFKAILDGNPTAAMRLNPDVPAELERMTTKCLEKDRNLRYQHASEIRTDLQRLKRDIDTGKTATVTDVVSVSQWSRPKTVAMIIVLAVMISALIVGGRSYLARATSRVDSIAVLPFVNTGGDANTEYLSDGITEGVIHGLSQLPQLRVMARTTVFRYKGQNIDPQKIGHDLNVQAVLIGTLVRHGDILRIETELVDVSNGAEIWGEKFDRPALDISTAEQQIASDISDKLRLRVSESQRNRLNRPATHNSEAYRLYVTGRFYWNKRTEDGLKKAIECFEQATEKDSNYALAYVGLADTYIVLPQYGRISPSAAMPQAKEAAAKALEIDADLPEAHASIAMFKVEGWDWVGAEKEFRRAIELSPNYSTAHHWYSLLLWMTGRTDESLVEITRARELDPLSPVINEVLAGILLTAGRYESAVEQLQHTLELDPILPDAHLALSKAFWKHGHYQEAIIEAQKAASYSGTPRYVAGVALALGAAGKKAEANSILKELTQRSKDEYVSPFYFAGIYSVLGQREQAFEWLGKAYQLRDRNLNGIRNEPQFDNIRSDSRFADLLKRMRLTIPTSPS